MPITLNKMAYESLFLADSPASKHFVVPVRRALCDQVPVEACLMFASIPLAVILISPGLNRQVAAVEGVIPAFGETHPAPRPAKCIVGWV